MTYFRGKTEGIVKFENKVFSLSFDIIEAANPIIYEWTKQVCEYRLHEHFERKRKKQIKELASAAPYFILLSQIN